MAFAATEKAKVWTSVRSKYRNVDAIKPSSTALTMPGFDGISAASAGGVEGIEVTIF